MSTPGEDGMRHVFEGTEGYYVESAPGVGPAHHDDLPASVGANENKRALADAAGRPAAPPAAIGCVVLSGGGQLLELYPPGLQSFTDAQAHAQAASGLVLEVVADYRKGGG